MKEILLLITHWTPKDGCKTPVIIFNRMDNSSSPFATKAM